MNQVLLVLAVLLYVVIGVMSAARSYGYAKRIGSPIVGDKLVIALIGIATVLGWPLSVPCERIIIQRRFPHLLPQKPAKVKKVNLLERIAVAVEGLRDDGMITVNRLLADAEYLRQRIAGLEQSQRDIRAAKDSIAAERDNANRTLQQARIDNEHLAIAVANAKAERDNAKRQSFDRITALQAEIARLTPPPAAPADAPVGA